MTALEEPEKHPWLRLPRLEARHGSPPCGAKVPKAPGSKVPSENPKDSKECRWSGLERSTARLPKCDSSHVKRKLEMLDLHIFIFAELLGVAE